MIRQMIDIRDQWACFDGEKIIPISRMDCDLSIPRHNLAPGMLGRNGNLFKDDQFILTFGRKRINILDENTLFVTSSSMYGKDCLEIYDIKTDKFVSGWFAIDMKFNAVLGYISANIRTRLLLTGCDPSKWFVLDISQRQAREVTHEYSFETEFGFTQVEFLYYDRFTGFPVMLCYGGDTGMYALLVFNGRCLSSLRLDEKPKFLGEYLLIRYSVYRINIDMNGELSLSFITDKSNPSSVLTNARDLAGMVYVTKSGVFRESITFMNTKMLSNVDIQPVNDIFWLGNDLVLLSWAWGSAILSLNPGSVVFPWYKCESTKFASELFQVCGTTVYNRRNSIDLPLPEAFMFVQSGNNLVVATPSKIAIISRSLEILSTFETTCVSLFSKGYVSATGVVFFDKPELNITAKGIVQACMVGDELFTLSRDGQVRIGSNMIELDLPLEFVSSIYSFGDTIVICDQSDTYIYNQGKYTSLAAGPDEFFVLSNDHSNGVFLKNGVASIKANAGFQMTRKPVAGVGHYDDISVYKDKLMCRVKPGMDREDMHIVKYISGRIIKQFKGLDKLQMCHLISDDHFVSSTAREDDGLVRFYDLNDLENYLSGDYMECSSRFNTFFYSLPEELPWICYSYHNRDFATRGALEVVDGVLTEMFFEDNDLTDSGTQYCRLGMRPCNYIRNGDHWLYVVYNRKVSPPVKLLNLLLKSEMYVDIPKTEEDFFDPQCDDDMSAVRSEFDSGIYYVMSRVQGTFNILKMNTYGMVHTTSLTSLKSKSVRYTKLPKKVKYDPDFVVSNGDFATITILREDEAETLKNLQKELIGNRNVMIFGDIDGRFLLEATMNPEHQPVFTRHGVDPKTLSKDRWDAFK